MQHAPEQSCLYLVINALPQDQQKWRELDLARPTPNQTAEFNVVTSSNNVPISEVEINTWIKALGAVCSRRGVPNMMARMMMRPHFDGQGAVARRDYELEFGAYIANPTPERENAGRELIRNITTEAYDLVRQTRSGSTSSGANIHIGEGVNLHETQYRAVPTYERVKRAIAAIVFGDRVVTWKGQSPLDARIDAAVKALNTKSEVVTPEVDNSAGGKIKW